MVHTHCASLHSAVLGEDFFPDIHQGEWAVVVSSIVASLWYEGSTDFPKWVWNMSFLSECFGRSWERLIFGLTLCFFNSVVHWYNVQLVTC